MFIASLCNWACFAVICKYAKKALERQRKHNLINASLQLFLCSTTHASTWIECDVNFLIRNTCGIIGYQVILISLVSVWYKKIINSMFQTENYKMSLSCYQCPVFGYCPRGDNCPFNKAWIMHERNEGLNW